MLDQMHRPAMQRTKGCARVRIDARGLRDLHQSGSAKAMLPRMHGADPEVVFLNTAGGVTGGDRLDYAMSVGAGARVTATTQTAERIYASTGETAQIAIAVDVATGSRLDWLPQETILFQNSALSRQTRVDLVGDATLLMVETVILGRIAMKEVLTRTAFTDRREVWRDGVPILIEPLLVSNETLLRGSPAGLGEARALSTLALVGPGAEDAVEPLRALVGDPGAVSGWDGKCVMRLMARDPVALRRVLINVIRKLRGGALPRVWQA